MPRLAAFLVIIFCALSAAVIGFSATPKPLVHVQLTPMPQRVAVVDVRVVVHDHVHEHSVPDRAKQLREAVAAVKLAVRYAAAQAPPSFVTPALWVCTAHHESGSLNWHNVAGPFEGPFDMAHTTWLAAASDLGLARQYPHAYDAPPPVQVEVAEHARARFGSSEWGGLHACGG